MQGTGANLVESLQDGVKNAVCAGAGGADWVAGLLSGVGIPLGGIQESLDLFQFNNCGTPQSSLPEVGTPPEFSGGQCEGVPYSVVATFKYPGGVGGAFVFQPIGWNTIGKFNGAEPRPLPSGNGNGWYLVSDVGELFAVSDNSLAPNQRPWSLHSITVTRTDGQPDDCGDPPGTPPAPVSQHQETIDLVFPDGNGDPADLSGVPVDFFPPCLNFDGIRIPFEANTPLGPVCGKVGIRPSVTSYVDFDVDIDTCPSARQDLGYTDDAMDNLFEKDPPVGPALSPDSEFAGVENGSFDPESQKPIAAVKIVSARVNTSIWPKETALFNDPSLNSPDTIVPDIGVYRFLVILEQEGAIDYAWTKPEKVQAVQQMVTPPDGLGAADFEVSYRPGWQGSYTAYRRKSCCEACKNADPNAIVDNLDRCLID